MIEMKQLQPELDKIKKKYKNPQKQQEETMKLYKEKGVNPAGGCLTSLIPLPIMIILWQVIYYFESSYAYNPRFLLWTDLSLGGFQANFFLLLIAIIASLMNALLMSQDARSAWTSVIMSVVFPFILIGLPVGVFIYYSMNSIIQTLLTFVYNRIYNVKGITIRQLVGLGPKPVRR
jgi:YidC/Oxa1 family membrane protein insertase